MPNLSRRRFFSLGVASSALTAACSTHPNGNEAVSSPRSLQAYDGDLAFDHGVAAGDATSEAMIVWSRITPITGSGPIEVLVFVSDDISEIANLNQVEQGGLASVPVKSFRFTTTQDRDFTVKVDLLGLKPATQYYYAFAVETTAGVIVSPIGQAKTLPAEGKAPYKIAVVSCSNFPFGFFNVYDSIANKDDVDAVVHLGDYLYEYGTDGYGGDVGEKLGRQHAPEHELLTLADYRQRHAQYKSDPLLQKAHAAAVWYCSWDDHESANDSYRTGAENHQPEKEGPWSERKAQAIQAYLEWMPVRDPVAGSVMGSVYRSFDIGDLATLFMLESRLLGRSKPLSFEPAMALPANEAFGKVQEIIAETQNPERTMLGPVQEAWLDTGLKASTSKGKVWQVLGNQVIMARVNTPNVSAILSEEQKQEIYAAAPYAKPYVEFSKYGLVWNMDAWDGYVAARERLFASAKDANARLVTLTGDTHTAWANELHDKNGERRGVEFGCTSVSSAGLGDTLPIPQLNELMAEKNKDVRFFDAFGRGYTLVTLKQEAVEAEYIKVSTVFAPEYSEETVLITQSSATEQGVSALSMSEKVISKQAAE